MHGQPPSITVMPRSRPYAVAGAETLPAPGPRCIQTCLIPSSVHSRIVSSATPGPRADHDRVDAAGDRAEIVVGGVALDLVCVRIDREDVVSALTQTPVDDVAPVAPRLSRHVRHRHPPVGKELRRRVADRSHRTLLSSVRRSPASPAGDATKIPRVGSRGIGNRSLSSFQETLIPTPTASDVTASRPRSGVAE
jgi:hypothetical protein